MTAHILLLSGEVSSDAYGAALARILKKLVPGCHIASAGGDNLRQISDTFVYETAYHSPLGLKGLKYRQFQKAFFTALQEYLLTNKPQVAVIVDFQHIHARFAQILTQYRVPIVTYITPNSWLWKDERLAKKIIGYSQDIVTIFEPEYDFYKHLATRVHYFGHPLPHLLPGLRKLTEADLAQAREGMPLVSLWPGSRKQEIARLLPKMLQTASVLHRRQLGHRFAVAVTDHRFAAMVQTMITKYASDVPILVWEGDKDPLLRETQLAMTASGTMTLHLMLYRIPMVILGALSPLSYLVAKYGLRIQIKHIGLPNILSQYTLVPEFIQNKMVPRDIADTLLHLHREPEKKRILSGYEQVIHRTFSPENPLIKTAEIILRQCRDIERK